MSKNVLIIFGIIIIIPIALITLPWLAIFIGIQLSPAPAIPEITRGEFPFRLEYEINGERKVIQDTLICEYDGIGANEGRGKYRKWKESLASGNQEIILVKVDNKKEIYYNPGPSDYYMDDMGDGVVKYNHNFPNACFTERDGKFTTSGTIHADELLKKHNIKLIKWDYTQPIKNNFTKK